MKSIVIATGVALALGGCGRAEASKERAASTQSNESAPASAASRWVPLEKPSGSSFVELPAIVRSDAEARGDVATLARVRVLRVHVQVGSRVEKGSPIVDVISPEILDAAGSLRAAAARARVHHERVVVLEGLLSEGLVTQAQVFEQKTAERLAEAERLRALGTLRGAGLNEGAAGTLLARGSFTLDAPIAGVVTDVAAYPGKTFEGGSVPLARLVGEGVARVEVTAGRTLPPVESLSFFGVEGSRIELESAPLARVREPQSGTERLWFRPRQETRLVDGLTGVVRIDAGKDVFQVPVTALSRTPGAPALFRRKGDNGEVVSVTVVGSSGTSALVRGPLALGERIATSFPEEAAP